MLRGYVHEREAFGLPGAARRRRHGFRTADNRRAEALPGPGDIRAEMFVLPVPYDAGVQGRPARYNPAGAAGDEEPSESVRRANGSHRLLVQSDEGGIVVENPPGAAQAGG